LQQLTAPGSLFKYQSGRVIALGRVMLAILFLLAVSLDRSEPLEAVVVSYALLILYAVLAVAVAAATWRNWWLDARLAVPTHGVDMAVFTAIVFSANGSTSPFFLFFVLPLLTAAIRWRWRETALTATALVALYLIAGLFVASSQNFELERFVVRSGYLLILSLLLIWFGIHQRFTRLFFRVEDFEAGADGRGNPLARALGVAMQISEARGGALLVGSVGDRTYDAIAISDGNQRGFSVEGALVNADAPTALLCDVPRDRALTRLPEGRFRFSSAVAAIDVAEASRLGLTAGLIAEVRTSTQQGWLVLWDIHDLSNDYIEVGRELGRVAAAVLDRHVLVEAIEGGAAARTRLSLARDVHDSIVQFLAGAAFRVEAIKRSAKSGAVAAELDELKRLLVEEQSEVRSFVLALRRDRALDLADAVAELRALAGRLSQQWAVECQISTGGDPASIPIRLQLDLQQLLREAVANAVRHGGAKRIDVSLEVGSGQLRLNVADDGSGFSSAKSGATAEPWSLKERVERANGSMRLVSQPGSTNILITLPLDAGAAA
jgi:signal transduction histidine kinase